MFQRVLLSSSVTLLKATPLQPNHPPGPITSSTGIVFPVGGKVLAADYRHLLHISTPGQQVSGNQHSTRARVKLPHNYISFLRLHITMHGRHSDVSGMHLLSEPTNLPVLTMTACVKVRVSHKPQRVSSFHSSHMDAERVGTLQGQVLLLDQNLMGSLMNFLVTSSTLEGIAADSTPPPRYCCGAFQIRP